MKDKLCSYYTDSEDIVSFMVSRLGLTEGARILEPSAGSGAFVDGILVRNIPVRIDALDIDPGAADLLERKYCHRKEVSVREADTLFDSELDICAQMPQEENWSDLELSCCRYDRIIGNPPYGAWQDYGRRDLLKKNIRGSMSGKPTVCSCCDVCLF